MARFIGDYFIEDGELIETHTSKAVPIDVPLVLLDARNENAIPMLLAYKEACKKRGCCLTHMREIDELITKFTAFRSRVA